jgi:hypothetical protein
MKIYIGPFHSWIGPYQIAEKLLFWMDKNDDERVHKFGTWLAGGDDKNDKDSVLMKCCTWIESKRHRTIKVRIDKYDTWSMDSTLAPIILPMLKQLKATKHGAPLVNPKDVPKNLRPTAKASDENGYVDDTHFQRWEWVLDEMIWAFEQLQPDSDWEGQYHTGVHEIVWVPQENGNSQMTAGPNDTSKFDKDGYMQHSKRIDNGTRLMGVYFRALWD